MSDEMPEFTDEPHRWSIEPHLNRDYDVCVTNSDEEARRLILETAEMYLWDGNEGEERVMKVTLNPAIPNAERAGEAAPRDAVQQLLNVRTAMLESAEKECDELREALRWCSGSQDFAPEGQARDGWLKICAPLLVEPELPAQPPAPQPAESQSGERVCVKCGHSSNRYSNKEPCTTYRRDIQAECGCKCVFATGEKEK